MKRRLLTILAGLIVAAFAMEFVAEYVEARGGRGRGGAPTCGTAGTPSANAIGGGVMHTVAAETYVITSGSGVLATGGHIGAPAHVKEGQRKLRICIGIALQVITAVVNAKGLRALRHLLLNRKLHVTIAARRDHRHRTVGVQEEARVDVAHHPVDGNGATSGALADILAHIHN